MMVCSKYTIPSKFLYVFKNVPKYPLLLPDNDNVLNDTFFVYFFLFNFEGVHV